MTSPDEASYKDAASYKDEASYTDAGAYFQAIERAYEAAEAAVTKVVTVEYVIAGHCVRLRVAGEPLFETITPALRHLRQPGTTPELTVHLFDSKTSGVPLPFPSPTVHEFYTAQEPWLYSNATRSILLNPRFQTLTIIDSVQRRAFFWTEDATQMAPDEQSFPLAQMWQWWLQPEGLQILHGGAVANELGAVVLMGMSGAGKSTTALACLEVGFDYLGDDLVMVRNSPEPYVYSLYSSAKVDAGRITELPSIAAVAQHPERTSGDKALLWMNEQFAPRLSKSAPVRAIVLPRVMGTGNTSVERIGGGAALRAATSTLQLIHGTPEIQVRQLAQFLQQVPCYRLALGPNLSEIPQVVRELLQALKNQDD